MKLAKTAFNIWGSDHRNTRRARVRTYDQVNMENCSSVHSPQMSKKISEAHNTQAETIVSDLNENSNAENRDKDLRRQCWVSAWHPLLHGCGRGVVATLGGRTGRVNCGGRPVSVLRKSVTLSMSFSLSFSPS